MEPCHSLSLVMACPIKAQNAGLFISRGSAQHPTRVINSHELIFVKQGELDMWEEGQRFHLEAGQTLHLWPGRTHGSSKPMPPDLRFYWIHFEVANELTGHDGREVLTVPACDARLTVPQVATIRQPERLERLFRTFLEDQETGMLQAYAANLLTTLMLVEVVQSEAELPQPSDDANVVATWAHTYIRMNFDRAITASKVAASLGYNPDYLGRIYHKLYGHTLTEAIHRRRVEKACEWLLDTNWTIAQIAARCGFSDADYFRRVFRRIMKVAPGSYRDEFTRVHVNTH
ncbi:MAG: AraC family transcriptional regulator [Chloroflexi bacterium]|nr:AraC family transcriptional regulator [Chloroflexota bacterium]